MNRRFNLAGNANPDNGPANQAEQNQREPRMGAGIFVVMMLAFPLQYYLTDTFGGEFLRVLYQLLLNEVGRIFSYKLM